MNIIDVCDRALAVLILHGQWVKGALCVDENDFPVSPVSENARRWSMSGAVMRGIYESAQDNNEDIRIDEVQCRMRKFHDAWQESNACPDDPTYTPVFAFNDDDDTTIEDVVKSIQRVKEYHVNQSK